MRARFAFDAAAWSILEARHTLETLASLMEVPSRLAAPGTPARDDEIDIHVGAPAGAGPTAASVIAVDGWPSWDARSLTLARLGGEPMPVPPGTTSSGYESRVLPPEWLRSAGFVLGREEESQDRRRDQWGCYSGVFSRQAELGILDRAVLNRLARDLERRLEAAAEARNVTLERVPRWKNGARFAAVLSHDVDDVTFASWRMAWRLLRQSRGVSSYAFRAGLTGLARAAARPPGSVDRYWTFERWMSEEERRGFRASWYFCSPHPTRRHEYDALYDTTDTIRFDGRRRSVAELMRAARDRGHEVGLHGSYMSHRDAAELARQRAQIAAAAGAEPIGIRQHFLRFDAGTTWRAHEGAGFAYDTTLGYNEGIGFRAGVAAPFRPWDSERGAPFGVWELPLTLMDGTLFRILKLDAARAAERVRSHLDEVEAASGLAVLLWHPNSAEPSLFPGWWASFTAALDHLVARGAWVATAAEVLQWWRDRQARMGGE